MTAARIQRRRRVPPGGGAARAISSPATQSMTVAPTMIGTKRQSYQPTKTHEARVRKASRQTPRGSSQYTSRVTGRKANRKV